MIVDMKSFRDRVLADIIAAPLRHSATYRTASVFAQWAETERYVRKRAALHREDLSATPADAENATEEAIDAWHKLFQGEKTSYRIIAGISAVSRNLLRSVGRSMVLQACENDPGREILRWRFISLTLPPGILMAAAADQESVPAETVQLLSRSIAPDRAVAELHLHHAAMTSFEDIWASLHHTAVVTPGELVRSLCKKRARCPKLHSGPCPKGAPARSRLSSDRKHMTEWADLLRQAFTARYILRQHSWHDGVNLRQCTECNRSTSWRNAVRYLVQGRTRPYNLATTPYPWPEDRVALEHRWRRAKDQGPSGFGRHFADAVASGAADERAFLMRAMAHARCDADDVFDQEFETLLLQYLRVKTAVFGLLVHAPGEHGLKKFLEHFSQIKVYMPESDLVWPQPPNEPGLDVQAIEYRVAPDAWFKILRREHAHIENDVTREPTRPEWAWLIHFKREKHDNGLPLYGSAIRKMEREADKIGRALAAKPARLRKLRGVDICGVEQDQPLWVSSDTLRRVRNHSRKIAGQRSGLRLEALRLTLHAGEDFSWLTSGMRAIAEPFYWKLIERGDRIGHGLAITLEPKEWWQRREGQVIPVQRLDRFLDLAFLAEYAMERSAEQEEWLRKEIRRTVIGLELELDDKPNKLPQLDFIKTAKEAWRCLGSRLTRDLMKTPRWKYDADRAHEKWIHSLLWRRSTQKCAAEEIRLKVEGDPNHRPAKGFLNECDLLIKARERLICEVSRWQVCIESNPSSNLVVGSLDSIAAQDFLAQRPTDSAANGKELLTWTIGTDDPITFSTTLADEYAYAWAGMVLRENNSYAPSYARALLDEAAATSMRMRFTVPDRKRGS